MGKWRAWSISARSCSTVAKTHSHIWFAAVVQVGMQSVKATRILRIEVDHADKFKEALVAEPAGNLIVSQGGRPLLQLHALRSGLRAGSSTVLWPGDAVDQAVEASVVQRIRLLRRIQRRKQQRVTLAPKCFKVFRGELPASCQQAPRLARRQLTSLSSH